MQVDWCTREVETRRMKGERFVVRGLPACLEGGWARTPANEGRPAATTREQP